MKNKNEHLITAAGVMFMMLGSRRQFKIATGMLIGTHLLRGAVNEAGKEIAKLLDRK